MVLTRTNHVPVDGGESGGKLEVPPHTVHPVALAHLQRLSERFLHLRV